MPPNIFIALFPKHVIKRVITELTVLSYILHRRSIPRFPLYLSAGNGNQAVLFLLLATVQGNTRHVRISGKNIFSVPSFLFGNNLIPENYVCVYCSAISYSSGSQSNPVCVHYFKVDTHHIYVLTQHKVEVIHLGS
jgi:hypothetical protein